MSANTLPFLHLTVERLRVAGVDVVIFGGWAEELTGLAEARTHGDIDLLHIADDFKAVDLFLTQDSGVQEVMAKHFAHKRAFVFQGVLVELLLITPDGESGVTRFWDAMTLHWPKLDFLRRTILPQGRPALVASPALLRHYRSNYHLVESARRARLPSPQASQKGAMDWTAPDTNRRP